MDIPLRFAVLFVSTLLKLWVANIQLDTLPEHLQSFVGNDPRLEPHDSPLYDRIRRI